MRVETRFFMAAEEIEAITMEFMTRSPQQTLRLGSFLGEMISAGMVVALIGNLGTGKTMLAKGISRGLGVRDEGEVTSPSFVLVNEYEGRVPVFHLDLYRLDNWRQTEEMGWDEWVSGAGVALVEWAEKAMPLWPQEIIEIYFQWMGPEERRLLFKGKGKAAVKIIQTLGKKWQQEA